MKYTGMDTKALRDSFRPQAERQVKVRLALEKIASLENIQPSEEELNAEYDKIAKNYGMEIEKVKELISQEDLAKDVAVEKAMSIVRDNAVITEKAEEKAE